MSAEFPSIAGSWRGRYFYTGSEQTFAFEAVFLEKDGLVEGNILDDDRAQTPDLFGLKLGEAKVVGKFEYPELRFTKSYLHLSLPPVHYHGNLSADGKLLSGGWQIDPYHYGNWMAMRVDGASDIVFSDWQRAEPEKDRLKREEE